MAFEALIKSSTPKPSRIRQVMLTGSLAVHAVALAVGVGYSLWEVEEMAMPAIQVLLTEAPPPPPPPPPPAGKKSSNKPKTTKVPTKKELVQPKDDKPPEKAEEPEEEEDTSDEGEAGGVAGGEKGGVAGGVVGGVVGAAPPPPPKPVTAANLSAAQARGLLAINPNASPYCCVKVPRALKRMDSFTAQVRLCVGANGQVQSAVVTRGANPALDSQIPGFIRRWRYRPYLVNGQATPFCASISYVMDVGS
jgi:periplasmic protein TonB